MQITRNKFSIKTYYRSLRHYMQSTGVYKIISLHVASRVRKTIDSNRDRISGIGTGMGESKKIISLKVKERRRFVSGQASLHAYVTSSTSWIYFSFLFGARVCELKQQPRCLFVATISSCGCQVGTTLQEL